MTTVALRKIQLAVAAIGMLVFAFGVGGITPGGLSAHIGQPHANHGAVHLAAGIGEEPPGGVSHGRSPVGGSRGRNG